MRRVSRPQKYKLFILNDALKAIIKLKNSPRKKTYYKRYLILRRRFYSSPEWKALSKFVRARANFRCQIKGCGNGNTELHVHHILTIYHHPELALCISNLICVCRTCHLSIHREAAA